MSYVHCPACQRAYNLATTRVCPGCALADATSEIVAAAEQLALAVARATPAELAAAGARLDRLALPSGAEPRALSSGADDFRLNESAMHASGTSPFDRDARANATSRFDRDARPSATSRFDRDPRSSTAGGFRSTDSEPTGARARSILSSIRAALRPEPPPTPGAQQALLATVALALISRLAAPPRRTLAAHATTWSTRARALLARF